MIRATDCATDPICYHTHGQGIANLNLSACFSCTLLPETSCEMFNCYLDRRILIDRDYGYFKEIIKKCNLAEKTTIITANYAENNLYIYRIDQNQDGNLYSSTQKLDRFSME